MHALSQMGTALAESYAALAERAERVERELQRTHAELERVLESLPTGVVVRDGAGRIVRTNRALRAILGLAPGELEGRSEHPLLAPPRGAWTESRTTRPDGRALVLASVGSPIAVGAEGAGDELAGSVQIVEDRTELSRLAERLHALDKLAALGNMAGGIAHELRNPMNAIKGFAALLAPRLEGGSDERRFAELIVEGVDEADAVLTNMLSLALPESLSREIVDAEALIGEALAMAVRDVSAELGASAPLERWVIASGASLARFEGDRIKLRQALRNLIANALQAQPQGGAVQISIAREGEEAVLRVRDAGPGIPPALVGRVLDPFFTTRAEGTGLGLALCATIAQVHGGRVDVARAPAPLCGADVSLRIPYRSTAEPCP
jgi:signal transduction histidine kinase